MIFIVDMFHSYFKVNDPRTDKAKPVFMNDLEIQLCILKLKKWIQYFKQYFKKCKISSITVLDFHDLEIPDRASFKSTE